MKNFVEGFSARYNFVPEELYGRLSTHVISKVSPNPEPRTTNVLKKQIVRKLLAKSKQ